MAKKKKAKSKTRTVTVVKNRVVRVKEKARRARRALASNVSTGEIVAAVGGAGVGSIGGSLLLAKMPTAIPAAAKSGILAGLGGFVAYKGIKKRNRLFMGLGLGAAAVGATNLISGVIGGGATVAAPFAGPLAAPIRRARPARLAAPFVPRQVETMAAPVENDLI